ncbi:MAG TPA: 4-alpha-glucanotransferase [Gemmatimonadales bacterium]|nr:4-alpha-glucanotransferase [Gemmatimonadales bacterium]
MSGDPSALHELAARVGILAEYLDQTGTEVRHTSDATRIAILGAMGLEASAPEAARAALHAMDEAERAEVLAPVRICPRASAPARRVEIGVPGDAGDVSWEGTLTTETGAVHRFEGRVQGRAGGGPIRVRFAQSPPEGYHEVRVRVTAGGREREAAQTLVVVPRHARRIRRVFGVIANLYTVRTEQDWGVGDLSGLGALLEWTASQGGAFVGVNPLHALRNRGWDVSPYSPVSRLFRNPLYLDPAAVPGTGPHALLDDPGVRDEQAALHAAPAVEYERVMALKRRVLERLHEGFTPDESYRLFRERQGEPLERFATYEALVDRTGRSDWREWPGEYHDPRSPAVERFRGEQERLVDYHRWVQFELDRQLAWAAERGRRAGLAVGLYQDLAIGTAPGGADVWADPELFLRGVCIGAPPDDLGPNGQNWGLPPVSPGALREDRYWFWIRLLRASLAHAGALRIDHVLGLFRQFWIPDGMHGSQGAYVRFPSDDLLGILLLEARRHDAVVVGEDLGTVPPEVPPALRGRGILSSRVFYFERDGTSYRPSSAYEPAALATANTHDLPPIAGYWGGRDIELRRAVGAIASDEAAEREWQARHAARQGILDRLAAEGELPSPHAPADPADLRGAVHQFLCRTPAAMVGLSLDDLVGETEPVNLPGVTPEHYSSWTRRLGPTIESLSERPEVRAALRCGARATHAGARLTRK